MRRLPLILSLAALVAVGTACEQEGRGVSGGQIAVGICEPDDLLPQNDLEICGAQVINNLFTGLVRYDDKTNEPENVMATSIESDDQTVWRIAIEDGWTFHNGEAVTAQSYVDSWNFGAKPANQNSYYFEHIKGYAAVAPAEGEPTADKLEGLRVVDETHFEVTLSAPFSQFPVTLGFQAFFPLPRVAFQDIKAFREAPIGNGPYRMDGSWKHDQAINVSKFDDYPQRNLGPDAVEFRIFSDTNAMYRELQSGDLDLAIELGEELIQQAKKDFPEGVVRLKGISIAYTGFPVKKPPFNNADVRRALSLATDRQAIIDTILFGEREIATSFVPRAIQGSRTDACEYCVHDPERAKELYQKAGGPARFNFWFPSDDPTSKQTVEAQANQWRKTLGVEVTFKGLPFSEFVEALQGHQFDGPWAIGWFADYPSPQNFLEPLFATGGAANDFEYSNKQVDDLIKKGNSAESLQESIGIYQDAEDIILSELPVSPFDYGVISNVYGEGIGQVTFRAGVLDLTATRSTA